jgi:hypothetical protein
MDQTLPRLSDGPPEKDVASQITLNFAMYLQAHFDEIIQDFNNDSIRRTKSPLGDLR